MLTLHHVEYRVSSIRVRLDLSATSLEVLSGKLWSYEMEREHRSIIYRPGSVDNKNPALEKTTALVAHKPTTREINGKKPNTGK